MMLQCAGHLGFGLPKRGEDEHVAGREGGSEQLTCTNIHESHVDLFQHAQDLGGPGVECAQPQEHPWRSRCEPMKPQGVQSGEVDTSKARGCGNASRVTIAAISKPENQKSLTVISLAALHATPLMVSMLFLQVGRAG